MILFLYTGLWVFRGCSRLACYFCFQNLTAISWLKETLGFDWVFVFWRPKILGFLYFAVSCVLIDCDCDETVLFELMITCIGLWLTCFMILFLYTGLWVFRGCSQLACYFCFLKDMQFCASRKRLALTESLFFWRPKILDFLYFAVSPCFNRLRLWWNCAFELIIKSIWLWLTCFVTKFVCITWVFSCCFRVAGFDCFQKELCAIWCLKEDERWPLTESLFFCRIKQWNFSFAVSFFSFKINFDCDEIVLFDWW